MDVLSLASALLFLLISVAAVASWWRDPNPVSRAVLMLFGAIGGLFVLAAGEAVGGPVATLLGAVAILLLLALPVLTLHLAAQVGPIPGPVLPVAVGATLLTALPVAVLGTTAPGWLILLAVTAFFVAELAAAGFLLAAARRVIGSSATRLRLAAGSTALIAAVLLAAGIGSLGLGDTVSELAAQVGRYGGLLAALGYAFAFFPPNAVRRWWHARVAYQGLRELLELADSGIDAIWERYLAIAGRTIGAGALLVIDEGDHSRVVAADGIAAELLTGPVAVPGALRDRNEMALAALPGEHGALDAIGQAVGARFVQAVSFGHDREGLLLVVLSSHRTLFNEEGRVLLSSLGQQTESLVAHHETLRAQQELATQLATTIEALRAASQAKSDFLASMSHELRTPLNAIIGFSDLMRAETPDDAGDIRIPAEWVEHIQRGGRHLVELVNDVLDLSKVEAGRLELDPEPIDLLGAVSESVAGIRPLADRRAHRVEVEVSAGLYLLADRGRLRQVLYNLLSNAIKFTPEGGRITVSGIRDGAMARLSVIDTGIGISAEDSAVVFEEFRQVGGASQRSEGTGLGLALTRRLVEAHGGRIELESTVGSGSRFTVVLPVIEASVGLAADAAALAQDEAQAATRSAGHRAAVPAILVVEDDPSAVRLLRAYLEPVGYQVLACTDGERAIEEARRIRPRAILLDVLLPGMDGWDVLRQLKDDRDLRDIPVVIVTIVDEREIGFALGAVDYLVKPVDRDVLLGVLGRIVPPSPGGAERRRILLVDDEVAALDALEASLVPAGFEVRRATDGSAAIELAQAHQPDLVICDLVMPGLDGFEVVRALRDDARTVEVPIIILTAHDLSPAEKQRLNGNVLAIVAKGPDARTGLRRWLDHQGGPAPDGHPPPDADGRGP